MKERALTPLLGVVADRLQASRWRSLGNGLQTVRYWLWRVANPRTDPAPYVLEAVEDEMARRGLK